MTSTVRRGAIRPRRGTAWRRLAITLVVLLVVLIALDRGGDLVAERLAASQLQSSQHLDKRPDVSIDGVPFLTQFARRDYDHIEVDADDLPVADGRLTVSHLHVDMHQLTISRDFATFHVDGATARATIDYAALSALIGVQVRYAGNDRIKASKSVDLPIVGTITPTITVRPELVNGALTFGASSINGAGGNLGAVSGVLTKLFDLSVPLNGLPFQITVRSLDVDASGVHADFVGADLSFTKNG